MSKYLKLFETVPDYTAAENTLVKPNVSLIEETNKVEYNPYIPPRNDIIIYTASEKLYKTWSDVIYTFGATIKSHTFENGVGTIEFNGNVTSIGYQAFFNCTNLTSITIPNSVTLIGSNAFYKCTNLTSITVESTTPPTLGSGVFNNNVSGRKIYVPSASVEIYKSASGWSNYASDIEAIPTA